MLDIIMSNRFKKDLKLAAKRGYDFREPLIKSKCPGWRVDFSPDEVQKLQAYFVYVKIFEQSQGENMPTSRVRRFIQRFPSIKTLK